MKRIIKITLSLLMVFTLSFSTITQTFAVNNTNEISSQTTDKVKTAINKLRAYYKEKGLSTSDEVYGAAAIGLDLKQLKRSGYVSDESLKTIDDANLAKGILTLKLLGYDPSSYEGNNYSERLKALVQDNGSIKIDDAEVAPNISVWNLYALYAINADETSKVADYLASQILESGAYYYEYNGKVADDSTTAWVIEALTLVDKDKYSDTISKAKQYLDKAYKDNGYYYTDGPYNSANTDTQSAVIEAYSILDKSLVTEKILNALLAYQLDNGSFFWNEDYNVENQISTSHAAQALGVYYREQSFITLAKDEATLISDEDLKVEVKEETKTENTTTENKTTENTNKESKNEVVTKANKVNSKKVTFSNVKTGDATYITFYIVAALISLVVIFIGTFFALRKKDKKGED